MNNPVNHEVTNSTACKDGYIQDGLRNLYLRLALLFSFAVMVESTLYSHIFLVPFIIILLNIYYPGEWYLSFIRILDVAIGGAVAVAMVYLSGSRPWLL